MPSPFFTWWPHQTRSTSGRETITLSEDLSDLQVTPKRDVVETYSVHGGRSVELLRPWVEVRIVLERFTDRALFRKFSAMINHLERGGVVAFGLDSAKAWMVRTREPIYQGGVTIDGTGNLANGFHDDSATTYVVTVGDEVIIESGPPAAKREYQTLTAITGGTDGALGTTHVTIDPSSSTPTNAFRDDYANGCVIRFSDFWPTLILPGGGVGSAMLTHDHRISYTLDLNLVYVIPADEEDTEGINLVGKRAPDQELDQDDAMVVTPSTDTSMKPWWHDWVTGGIN